MSLASTLVIPSVVYKLLIQMKTEVYCCKKLFLICTFFFFSYNFIFPSILFLVFLLLVYYVDCTSDLLCYSMSTMCSSRAEMTSSPLPWILVFPPCEKNSMRNLIIPAVLVSMCSCCCVDECTNKKSSQKIRNRKKMSICAPELY